MTVVALVASSFSRERIQLSLDKAERDTGVLNSLGSDICNVLITDLLKEESQVHSSLVLFPPGLDSV